VTRRVLVASEGTRSAAYGWNEWGLLIAIALMWGSSFLWIAEGVATFSPPVVSLSRLVLGAAALAVFPATRQSVERSDYPRIIALALIWMAIPLLIFPVAQQWVDSSIAGAINGGTPLFSAVVAAILLRRIPRPVQISGFVIGLAGVLLVTLSDATGADGSPLGIILIVLATAMYGVAFNIAVPLVQKYGSLPVLLRAQLIAIVAVLPFGLAGIPGSEWSWSGAWAMVALGVLSTGLAYIAMGVLGARVGAARGSVPVFFLPIVALLLGVLVRGEHVQLAALVGIGLVIVGAWLTTRADR